MTFVTELTIGLIISWIIEWVIDLLFWGRDDGVIQQKLVEAETKIKNLEAELARSKATVPPPMAQTIIQKKDNLEQINGIGPIFNSFQPIYNFCVINIPKEQ